MTRNSVAADVRGGLEAAVHGLSASVAPILFFLALFGSESLAAALWATLITACVVRVGYLVLRGSPALIPTSRVASLTVYTALILQLGLASDSTSSGVSGLTLDQFGVGLAAASLLFTMASTLILLLGALRLGNVFKIISTPVTTGISNGTAMLLAWLAFSQIRYSDWAAAATALLMLTCYVVWPKLQSRFVHVKLVPAVAVAIACGLAFTLVFHKTAWIAATRPSIDGIWISMALWPKFLHLDWAHLLAIGLPGGLTLALVMVLETVTAASLMETRFGVRIDISRELLATGGANMISALIGGVPTTASPICSSSNWIAGGRGALAGLTSLVLTTAILLYAGRWIFTLPVGMVAGMFLLQVPLTMDWIFVRQLKVVVAQHNHRRSRVEKVDLGFWIATAISFVAFFGNLIWACALGIALSCLVVLRSVAGGLISRWAYLNRYASQRARSPSESLALSQQVHKIGILPLTGHLFFGNSARIVQLPDELHQDAVAVVVDVSHVTDVDTSGSDAVLSLVRALTDRQVAVVISGAELTHSEKLQRALQSLSTVEQYPDLDRALEVCENLLLHDAKALDASTQFVNLARNQLFQDLTDSEIAAVLLLGLVREVQQGTPLFRKNSVADGIWLLESGLISILANDLNSSSRLATFGPGQFVGEMGLIDGNARSATAYADTPVRALLLSNNAIDALMRDHPAAALKITRNIARELSNRVRRTSSMLAVASR